MDIFSKSFYIKSPVCLQQLFVTAYGSALKLLREGGAFEGMLASLEKSQWYSSQELKALQCERLQVLVRHAYQNVPYYRDLFHKLGLLPSDIRTEDDLHKIPTISKRDVINNPEIFLARNVSRKFLRVVYTSGTTGAPLKLYRDLSAINFDNAILKRQYRWAGLKDGMRRAVLRSTLAIHAGIRKPPFWRYDAAQKILMISAYHLSKDTIGYYADVLAKYKSATLETVPSIGYFFAKLLDSSGRALSFDHILTTSEVFSAYKRELMQQFFKGDMVDYYGVAERVCTIGMCEKKSYHVNPEYGITEFLPTANADEFEIVGTGFMNMAMPLLRYKTGDVATLGSAPCDCGRHFQRVARIEGRLTDKPFITSDGRMISLLTGVLSIDVKGLLETQFIQSKIGELDVKVVVDHRFGVEDEIRLLKSFRNYLGCDTLVRLEKVACIPREKSGKFKQFVSLL